MSEKITVTSEYLREKEKVLQNLLKQANIEFFETLDSMQTLEECFHLEAMEKMQRGLMRIGQVGEASFTQIQHTVTKLSMIAAIYENAEKENSNAGTITAREH